jgi:hypothetical protein
MAEPSLTSAAYAPPGSWLPSCSEYRTEPWKTATVTTGPSAIRVRDTVIRGGLNGTGLGEAATAWLARAAGA